MANKAEEEKRDCNKEEFIDSQEHLITFNYDEMVLKYASDCCYEKNFYDFMFRDL